MKLALVIAIAAIAVIGWSTRGTPTASPARNPAAPAGPVRLSPEQFAVEVRNNAPLRAQLAQQYPDVYRDLGKQVKGNIDKCVVTKVFDGVLKAVCH